MILYILRHAEAIEASDAICDEWRYLTENGRKSVERISRHIGAYGRKPHLIISSPLVRAVQTAQLAAMNAGRRNRVVISGLLAPGGAVEELITHLKGCTDAKRVMVVGHEPQLGSLVAALLMRNATISLKKAGCVALEFSPEKGDRPADFLWYAVPGKKVITALKKAFPAK
jgi:phosphohistidine phosphatase